MPEYRNFYKLTHSIYHTTSHYFGVTEMRKY